MCWGHKRKEMAKTLVIIQNFKFKWGGRFSDWDQEGRVPFLIVFKGDGRFSDWDLEERTFFRLGLRGLDVFLIGILGVWSIS